MAASERAPLGLTPIHWVALGFGFVAIALLLAWPAIDGGFLSDDHIYIVNDPYVHGLSVENVLAILHPYGPPTIYSLNYAPVHLLLHAAQWELVGDTTRLYHVTNAVAHGLTTLLLIVWLVRGSVPVAAAVLAALLFLVHPANVETVNWIFQLKTIVALALSLGALLLHARRPGLAASLFALALLTKVTALGVLPVLAVQSWIRSRGDRAVPPRWGWLAVWIGIAVLVSIPEMAAFQRQSDPRILIHEDAWVHGRTIIAIAARYLWMALTGLGVAAFHEPPPAESWLDPWFLAGLAGLGAIGARTLQTFLRGEEEACFWVFAAAAFGPVSQIFPFIFPMGDRYLYPILPGLIGAAILALRPAWRWADASLQGSGGVSTLGRGALVAALAMSAFFGVRSHTRAAVYADDLAMMVDAAMAYPDGMMAQLLRGHQAARVGDVVSATVAFERAVDLGFSDLAALLSHAELQTLQRAPIFQHRVLRKMARLDIERLSRHEDPEQSELMTLALAYEVVGDPASALAALERAREAPGAFDDLVAEQLRELRTRMQRRAPSAR